MTHSLVAELVRVDFPCSRVEVGVEERRSDAGLLQ